MRRRSGKKKPKNSAKRSSTHGSIFAIPFVALVSILKLPIVALAFVAKAIGSIALAMIKLLPAAVTVIWRAIGAVLVLLLRIPFGSIGKMLVWSVALVWRIAASAFVMLLNVLSNPRGLALAAPILIFVMVAAYPESRLGFALVAAIAVGGVFWMFRQPKSSRVVRISNLGDRETPFSLVPNTRDLDEIYALTPREFEVFVRDVLTDIGYWNLSVVGGPGDLGVDIIGHDASGRSVAVQCKRYARDQRIGSKTIQTFVGMQRLQYEADLGIFVTTADFTRDARQLAARYDIWLINGAELVGLVHGG